GPFIAAGPIMAALAGAGVGGAAGGLTGALVGMGIPEYEAKRYEGRVKDGGILLSAHSDDSQWTKRAKEILERTGAEDVASTGEAKGEKRDAVHDRDVAWHTSAANRLSDGRDSVRCSALPKPIRRFVGLAAWK